MNYGVVTIDPAPSTLQRIKTARAKKNKEDRARLKTQLLRIGLSESAMQATLERQMGPVKSLREIRTQSRTVKSIK
jgi:hypothetical protein